MTEATRKCRRCRRRTLTNDRFRKADPDTRKAWRAAGIVRFEGRGLCASCYRWALNHDRLLDYDRTNARWADVIEDYRFLHNPNRTQAENVRHLAPRLGISEDALHHALVVNKVRSRFRPDGMLKESA